MRNAPSIATFISLVFLASLLPHTSAAADDWQDEEGLVHFRTWTSNDFWRWDKIPSQAATSGTSGTIYWHVSGQELYRMALYDEEKHQDWHKRHMSWTIDAWTNQTANTPAGPGAFNSKQTRYYKVDDLGLVAVESATSYVYSADSSLNQIEESRMEFFPPRLEMIFPFAVGDEWTMRSYPLSEIINCDERQGKPCKSTTKRYHTYEVLRYEALEVQLADGPHTFDTWVLLDKEPFQIRDVDNPENSDYHLLWYAPEACQFVKKEEYRGDNQRKLFTHLLTDFRCAATERPDPTYSGYSFQNLSATRFHGELAKQQDYEDLLEGLLERAGKGGKGGAGGFGGSQLGQALPGPGVVGALVAMAVGLVLAGRARRAGPGS